MATEKERGCHIHVLMDDHFLILKYPNKLLKKTVCELYF